MWAKTWEAAKIVENSDIRIKIRMQMRLNLERWSIVRTKPPLSIKTCSTKLTLATIMIMDDTRTTVEIITWRHIRQNRKITKEARVRSPVASTLRCTPSSRQQSSRILMAAGTITTSSLCPGCSDEWTSHPNLVTRWRNKATVCLTLSWWRCHLPSLISAKLILQSKTAPWQAPCKADSRLSMEHLPTRKVSPYNAHRLQTGWKTSTAASVSNPDSIK